MGSVSCGLRHLIEGHGSVARIVITCCNVAMIAIVCSAAVVAIVHFIDIAHEVVRC